MAKIRNYGLILANDIVRPEEALRVSEVVAKYVDGIKIGIPTTLEPGLSLMKKIKERTKKAIIADFKVADIGFWNKEKGSWEGTNAKIVERTADAGADYIICHTIVGTSSIQECVEVAHSKGAKIWTLPFMTHKGAELVFGHPLDKTFATRIFANMGINIVNERINECHTISDLILVLGDHLGVDGFIGPANNLGVLRRYREFTNRGIFGPGIGRQAVGNLTLKDQLRNFYQICGENSAVIIGSAIYQSTDPAKAANQFANWRDEIAKEL